MKKNGFFKKLLLGVAVSLVAISAIGFVSTLTKPFSGSKAPISCNHIGGQATCVEGAVCDACETVYGEVDADNHVKTAETALWTAGEGEYVGFDVKACDCGHVYETFDVTNETIEVVNLGIMDANGESTAKMDILASLDEKFYDGTVKGELMDILYNGESVIDFIEDTVDDFFLPASIFGNVYGRQYLSFIFVDYDNAEHEVKVYVDVVNYTGRLVAVSSGEKVAGNTYRFILGEDNFSFHVGSVGFLGQPGGGILFGDCPMGTTAPFSTVAGDGFVDVTFNEGDTATYYGNPLYDEHGTMMGYDSITFTLSSDMTLGCIEGQEVYRVEKI